MRFPIYLFLLFLCSCVSATGQDNNGLKQYEGKYKFPSGSIITELTATVENGTLIFRASLGNASLEKTGEDAFAIPAYQGTVQYNRNNEKKITGLRIEVIGNIILEGCKDESSSANKKSDPDDDPVSMPFRLPMPNMLQYMAI